MTSTSAQELLSTVFIALLFTGMLVRLTVPSLRAAGTICLLTGQFGAILMVLPDSLRDHDLVLGVCGAIAGTAAIAAARRLDGVTREWILIAIAATVALRIPFELGGERFILPLPLYLVLAVAGLRLLMDDAAAPAPPQGRLSGGRLLDAAVASFAGYATLSTYWALDGDAAVERIALIFAPFTLLYICVRTWYPSIVSTRRVAGVFVGVMTLAAGVGIFQHVTGTIWQNPKVQVANAYTPDFRVNSTFWDPNIFGRYLVVALLAVFVGVLVKQRSRPWLLTATAAVALIATALWYSYSQSSFAALAAASAILVLVSATKWLRRGLAVVAVAGLIAMPFAAHALNGKDSDSRTAIAKRGLVLTSYQPIEGVGIASFEEGVRQVSKERGAAPPRLQSSHTTPVTVLAELGVVGLALYLLVITAAGAICLAQAGRFRQAALVGPSDGVEFARIELHWWAAAALAALVTHSMLYSGFFEDPIFWIAAAILAATASVPAEPNAALAGDLPAATAHDTASADTPVSFSSRTM
jgi:hypothetical protein